MKRVLTSFGIETISPGQVSRMTKELENQVNEYRVSPLENESNDTWLTFFDKLKKRGVSRIGLLVSDGHPGIQSALKKAFIGSTWQRCKVHFMRNIFTQDSYNEAKRIANDVIDRFESQFPEAMDVLSDGLEDAVQFFHFPVISKSRTSSTNHLERLNREIRRRSNVVGTFPSTSSFLRLIGSYLLEYQEEWQTANSFIDPDRLISFWSNFKEVSMAA